MWGEEVTQSQLVRREEQAAAQTAAPVVPIEG